MLEWPSTVPHSDSWAMPGAGSGGGSESREVRSLVGFLSWGAHSHVPVITKHLFKALVLPRLPPQPSAPCPLDGWVD